MAADYGTDFLPVTEFRRTASRGIRMKVVGKTDELMGMVYFIGRMAIGMKVVGREVFNMVMPS